MSTDSSEKDRRLSSLRRLHSRLVAASKTAFPDLWLYRLVGPGARIFTYTPSQERLLLYDEARLSLKLGLFLEIGSHLGASAVVLAEVLKRHTSNGRVYCIDTWMNDAMSAGPKDTRKEFNRNTARWVDFICPVVGDSKTVSMPFEQEYDLVFIDGDHSYEGVRSDADRFAKLVRRGGRLLMHDHDRTSVARVAAELLATGDWTISRSVGHLLSLKREQT